jgi:hypothetical protein
MIAEQKVHQIKNITSLLSFLREELNWQLPDARIDDITFEWTGTELNLSEDIHKKLKDGIIRQLQPFKNNQPWGIFVIEFAVPAVSVITLRQILRRLVSKRRSQRPDLPSWKCENLLFISLYGEDGFTFAHFRGEEAFGSRLTTFSWRPGEPIRTLCEYNLPALEYDHTWSPETWVAEWQKAFDVERVNKLFYKEIAQLYYRLTGKSKHTRELVLPSKGEGAENASFYEEFAVRLIGRTIFCWFLKHKKSDKGVPLIPAEVLSLAAAKEAQGYYHAILEPLFFEVMNKPVGERKYLNLPKAKGVPFLNGGLFEPHGNDFYNNAPAYSLTVPDAWFVDFLTVLEQYNFTITENSSIDVDVSVDPEMLGRIFENLLAEVNPETGETARKATGSYYTPRVIVDYMVEQSLKQYLLTKTRLGEKKVDRLLAYEEGVTDFSEEEKVTVVTSLKEIKIIDPACGSGAFPLGILHRMLLVLEKVDPKLETWRKQYLDSLDPMVRQMVEKNIRRENWAYIRKLMIIRDSIYGVDIQPIAVEIAKLRCFLSLVVDERVFDNEENRGVEPLPNLEFKFVAANTLIGLPATVLNLGDFTAANTVKELKSLRDKYLRSYGGEKKIIETQFRETQAKLRESIEWAIPASQINRLVTWDPFSYESCGWFDPEWMFGVSGGFDIVIANPPYIRQEQLKELKPELKKYFLCYNGTADIYVYFYERGKQILNKDGTLTYISSNKYFRSGYGEGLRRLLSNNCQICQIIDFGDAPVFEAISYPSVIVLRNTLPQANEVQVFTWQPGPPLEEFASVVRSGYSPMPQKELTADGWHLESPTALRLLEKLRQAGKPLGEYVNGRFYRGIVTGLNEAFVVDRITRDRLVAEHPSSAEVLKPFLRGKDVKRWHIELPDLWIIFTRRGIDIKNYPAIQNHLAHYKKQLTPGTETGRKPGSYEWYEIQDNIAYWREFEEPKIVWGNLAVQPKFAFVDAGYYISAPANIIVSDSRYLLGVLNSQITRYLVSQSAAERQGGYLEYKPMYISPLAIPEQPDNERISGLVSAVISAKSKDPDADVSDLEHPIDQLVYELYGLTPEEIAVVEGINKK